MVPEDTVLTARPEWVQAWSDLSADERRLLARQQEVFAGFLTHTDAQIGRVLSSLERLGAMDNTMVLVFSDNGASAEGGKIGSFNEHRFTAHLRESVADNLAHYDDWGGFSTYNHYSWAWAWAGNTPHKLWKRYTWLGGTRTPLIVHWADRIAQPGTVRTQFAHAIDLMPTIMAAAGLDLPDEVDGVAQQVVDGVSLVPVLEDPAAAELHHTQYFEMMGSRSIYHEGWKATTNHISTGVLDEEELAVGSRNFDDDRWELFDLSVDFSEAVDRAGDEPERVHRLTELWAAEAGRNNVLPISDGLVDRLAGFIPPTWPPGPSRTYRPGGGPVADESVPLLWGGFTHDGRDRRGTGRRRRRLRRRRLVRWLCPVPGRRAGTFHLRAVGRHSRAGGIVTVVRPAATRSRCPMLSAPMADRDAWSSSSTTPLSTRSAVEGMLPVALQHGGRAYASGETAASRCRRATRLRRLSAAMCTSCTSRLRVGPGLTRPTKCGRHSTPTDVLVLRPPLTRPGAPPPAR